LEDANEIPWRKSTFAEGVEAAISAAPTAARARQDAPGTRFAAPA
jgi:hypothetical protein